MKNALTVLVTISFVVTSQGQDTKNLNHGFEINLNYFQVLSNQFSDPYIWPYTYLPASSGGYRIGGNFKYSISVKKWFFDTNINLLGSFTAIDEAYIEQGLLMNFQYRQRLCYLQPEFSFGRFVNVSENFRISLALGFGTSFLMTKKPEEISVIYPGNSEGSAFYEGNILYDHEPRLTSSVQMGIYIPCERSELTFKIIVYNSRYTASRLELYRIVDYAPEKVLDAECNVSGMLFGISCGYRFSSKKLNKN